VTAPFAKRLAVVTGLHLRAATRRAAPTGVLM
jgi:hypothetical protein